MPAEPDPTLPAAPSVSARTGGPITTDASTAASAPPEPIGPTVGELGEDAVLLRITARLPAAPVALVGPGDDAAVLAHPDGRSVVTSDTMVEGPDFLLGWSSPHDLGWKAAATNLADVAAMGARPVALTVSLVAPIDTPIAVLEGIADGLRDACAALAPGCGVVGGDLARGPVVVLAITAVGDLGGRDPVLRSGARAGDTIAVAGDLGAAARGLARLRAHAVDAEGRPDPGRAAALRAESADVRAQLAPHPPIHAGPMAAAAGATAMLDVSDGLVRDAARIAAASGVALDFDVAAVGSAIEVSGEDHALLACFPAGTALPPGFRRLGTVREGEGVRLAGRPLDREEGWDPYSV